MQTATHHTVAKLNETFPHGVARTVDLRAVGITANAIATRCRPGGLWRRLLPGIVLLQQNPPSREQQLQAAVTKVGGEVVITGADALQLYGVSTPLPPQIRLLVPEHRRVTSREIMIIERTTRMPEPNIIDGLPLCPPERAILDTARHEQHAVKIHDLLLLSLRRGLSTVEQLKVELAAGNQRGSAAVREALKDLELDGQASSLGAARELLKTTPLPPPIWDIYICDRFGRPLGKADAWWDEIALGWQFTTAEQNPTKPALNQLALTAAGVVVVRSSTKQLAHNQDTARELVQAFRFAAQRKRPPVQIARLDAVA